MAKNELYINVETAQGTHRIDIAHDEEICDAEISVDGTAVETDSSMISGGAQIKFKAACSQIMIFILESGDDYDYDCFVDGISVKNGAPFEVNGYTFTKALSWKQKRLANKNKYILVEALKGIIAGCVIFLALYFVQYISTAFYHIFDAHWGIFMIASLVLPTALFAIIAVGDYKKNEAAYNEYKKYLEK